MPAWLRQHAGPVPASVPEAAQMMQRVRSAHAWLRTQIMAMAEKVFSG